jgi:serine/threonine protein kinase
MTPACTSLSFKCEAQNYTKAAGSPYMASLFAVVTVKSENRGILIEFVDGTSLDEVVTSLTTAERYSITRLILEAVKDLESRGYYPQDLKCNNILWDKDRITIIDLGGGLTLGMYRPEAEWDILQGRITGRDMLFGVGRTLWELFDPEYPEGIRVPEEGSLPLVIRDLIRECCAEDIDPNLKVADIWEKYHAALEALALEGQ